MSDCHGEKFGHDFPYPGSNCTRCGINQDVLSGRGSKQAIPSLHNAFARLAIPKKPIHGMHSEIHALVNEVRALFGETAKKGVGSFGFYLGFFSRLGVDRVRQLLAETRESANPKKSFWWKAGQMSRRPKEEVSNG